MNNEEKSLREIQNDANRSGSNTHWGIAGYLHSLGYRKTQAQSGTAVVGQGVSSADDLLADGGMEFKIFDDDKCDLIYSTKRDGDKMRNDIIITIKAKDHLRKKIAHIIFESLNSK